MFLEVFLLAVMLANGNYNVHATLPSGSEGLETIIKSWFPDDAEFNEGCVSEGCPALKNFSLCPNDINIPILHNILKTATDCMRKPICGTLIDSRPTESLTMTTEEWLEGKEIYGTATTLFGTGHLTNVSNTEFKHFLDHHQTHRLPLRITMVISNSRASGYFQLDLSLSSMLPSILGQALSVTIPAVKYDIGLEYISTLFINQSLTDSNYDIKLLNPIIQAHPMFCGLHMPEGFPSVITSFTSMTQIIVKQSSWAVRKAAFLEKYFKSVAQSISNKC